MIKQERLISETFKQHVMKTRVEGNYGYLAVLSDIHMGLNGREYLQQELKFLNSLPDNVKVVVGGDATNTTTKNSKGSIREETLVGDEQVYALYEDLKPLYNSGKLLGITSGNHPNRVYNETYISIEGFVATLLGDKSLFKGSQGVVYFNVNKNCYVHYIVHKHTQRKDAYDYFNADATWKEHLHRPEVTPKIAVSHNLFAKTPVARVCYEIKQPAFQVYPDYVQKSGGRPLPLGYYICQMSGDIHDRRLTPIWNEDFKRLLDCGMKL